MIAARQLSSNLTSYDFVKFAALALMVVDHVGHFFYPDEMWLRAIGRLSAPIWLFLIGYARSRDLPWAMWAGTILLLAVNYIVGKEILPVYIIGSMLLFRFILDPVMNYIRRDPKSLYPLVAVLLALTVLTAPLFEYGAEAFIAVMAGYICRNRAEMGFDSNRIATFMMVAAFTHFLSVYFFFFGNDFSSAQYMFVGLGLVCVMLGLSYFKPAEYPALTQNLPRPLTAFVQFCGRWTLEIYVVHVAAFHFIALYNGDDRFKLVEPISRLLS